MRESTFDLTWLDIVTTKSSSTTDLLSPIWRRLLQRSNAGIEDNFFDLGGDSSIALELFNEVAKVFGRELPPVTIYQTPTIASLAALLEEPIAPRFPALVLLKEGAKQPPIFMAHGLGGSVIDFYQPAKHFDLGHPIYGMQAKGIDGVDEPLESIEDMAQFYLEEIKQLQPRGPYVLMGFSLGGLVTLEMAQRLNATGEKIRLLVLLDAYPYYRYLSLGQRMLLMARQAKHRVTLKRLPVLGELSKTAPYQPPAGISFNPAMQRVRDAAYLAMTRYQPRFYDGSIKFVRAKTITGFPADPRAVWRHLAANFQVDTVPGDHLTMLTHNYEPLAAILTRYLREAF